MTRRRSFSDLDARGVPAIRQVPILNIRQVMVERDVQMIQLSISVSLGPSEIEVYMLGEKPFPWELLVDIARALDVPVSRLVEGADELAGAR
ncbi:hypothetical protein GCM10025864_24360 [Luteimicrobium album]|uniref:Uncharacterized protein n=1 Tax=Luteimicrobium album TaxID=1054550 RepID=A0ABQ6I361_9MICO|nr:hypothetical protein [Luteimicrobium album]GMA24677.1 hypothetical protein GCM10025864_24360 [Luteimicrobium album]